jgi:hypothetical protein
MAVVCFAACATIAPAGSPARPLVTGITDPYVHFHGGGQLAFNRMRAAGARFARVTAIWIDIAPGNKPASWQPGNPADPHYNWSAVDPQVMAATRAGLTPLLQIATVPRWAARCEPTDVDPIWRTVCDPDPAEMAAFGKAAARRYSGRFRGLPRVSYYQLLNEPNLSIFFQPQFRNGKVVSPYIYRALLNRFTPAVKSINRSNLVLFAGSGPLRRPGGIGPLDFMRKMLCMRGRRKPRKACNQRAAFDIWAHNPYTTGSPTHEGPHPDDTSLGDLPEMSRLLHAADRAGRIANKRKRTPFWITEFGWDSSPPDPGGLSIRIHSRWTAEAMYRAWKAGVSKFFWFLLRDEALEGRTYPNSVQSGLYLRGPTVAQDQPKRTLQAFRFPFVAFRTARGIFFWGRTPNSRRGRVKMSVSRGRGWRRIATTRANRAGIFRGLIRTRYGRGKRGHVRATVGGNHSVPFSLKPVPDFYQPPFG